MTCGVLPPNWANIVPDQDRTGCERSDSHTEHVFKTELGKFFIWGDAKDCRCDDCLHGEPDEHCIDSAEITAEEFNRLTGQT